MVKCVLPPQVCCVWWNTCSLFSLLKFKGKPYIRVCFTHKLEWQQRDVTQTSHQRLVSLQISAGEAMRVKRGLLILLLLFLQSTQCQSTFYATGTKRWVSPLKQMSEEAAVSVSVEASSRKHRIFSKASSRRQSSVSGGQTETGSAAGRWSENKVKAEETKSLRGEEQLRRLLSTLQRQRWWWWWCRSPASQTQQLLRGFLLSDNSCLHPTRWTQSELQII